MKGFSTYRNYEVVILNSIHNPWLNRVEYLIVVDYRTEWVSEDSLGPITWLIGA